MPFPKVRMTINAVEALLLMPGLNTVVDGLVTAKLGAFPYMYPYDRLDPVRAAAIYKSRAYNDETAGHFLALRDKLRAIPQSRKTRIDVVDAAVAGFALRLWKAHKPSGITEASATAVKRLQKKIERYRRRAKRAAITRVGTKSYQETAERWRRFVAWARYHLLYFKVPSRRRPYWSIVWRNQRRELTQAFEVALRARFFEVPSDVEMVRLVTLATRSLKRSRHAVSFMDLLHAPQSHVDFLISLARKRVTLKRLPGAAAPRWESASDRADAFRAFRERMAKTALSPSSANPLETIAVEQEHHVSASPTPPAPNGYTLKGKAITAEIVCDGMAEFLYEAVTVRFGLTREVCEQAQFLIRRGCLDNYRVQTTAMSFEGLLNELRPADFDGHRIDVIVIYAEWLLKVLLALRQKPEWMIEAFTGAWIRAKHLEEKAAYDGWVASRGDGS